ncbi:MAG: kinase [Chloroflexi bacterium]|nr:hypothetical protein [Ktedonobacteraceae bacterium]MBV9019249.1 hypothetical protein [Ktedonobacteraceae bacterium]MBV9706176.1 kinase [Chloroflexota bacterium]
MAVSEVDLKVGHGQAYAHHGELLQGMFADEQGYLHYGLVTLPCMLFHTEVTFTVTPNSEIIVEPATHSKAFQAAKLTLHYCNRSGHGGHLKLNSNIPLKMGFGSSTSDVCATIRAVAQACSFHLLPEEIAQIAVQAEQASDSIMFDTQQTVLFAQREGIVLEEFHKPLPVLEIIGFNTDATGQGIDTLTFTPIHYSHQEIEAFRVLLAGLRKAIALHDPYLLGRVTTASAYINQRYLPKPHFDRLLQLASKTGALGLQVAHSGTIVGFLFDPEIAELEERVQMILTHLFEMGFHISHRFRTEKRTSPRKNTA